MSDLEVPRRIDKTIGREAKTCAYAKTAKKSRRRRKAIGELKKLRLLLEQLQMRTIDGSLPPLEKLEKVLKAAERSMRVFTAKKPKRRRLRKLAKGLKRARTGLQQL
ncbi:MAG: hypothetical protein ACJATT_000244 [Myxococcota bacterium]